MKQNIDENLPRIDGKETNATTCRMCRHCGKFFPVGLQWKEHGLVIYGEHIKICTKRIKK